MNKDLPLNTNYSSDDLRILYTLAHTLWKNKEYEQAKTIFQQLALTNPFVKKYWLGLGTCWQFEKKYSEALKAWEMLILLDEIDPTPHYQSAECYFALNEISEGFKAMRLTKSRLSDEHADLKEKLIHLESLWKIDEKHGT